MENYQIIKKASLKKTQADLITNVKED